MRRLSVLAVVVGCLLALAGCGITRDARTDTGGLSRPTWLTVAKHRAFAFWHRIPCNGQYTTRIMPLAPQLYGQFWLWKSNDGKCVIARIGMQRSVFGPGHHPPFSLYCQVFLHEYGHLLGHVHSRNPQAVMYPVATSLNTPRVCQRPELDGDQMPLLAGRQ